MIDQTLEQVPPLAFFTQEKIHPDNQKTLQEEQLRYRSLSFVRRLRLWWYVRSLRIELKRQGYNRLAKKRDLLLASLNEKAAMYRAASEPEEREHLKRQLREIIIAGRQVTESLDHLKETHERYKHYSGWLEYERANRKQLIEEERRERTINRQMRKEARWIETLLRDVFRKTVGCHHLTTDGKGTEICHVPKFERSVIGPDAHYFYLAASRRVLLGYKWLLPYGVTIRNLTDEQTLENMRAATKREVTVTWSESGQLIFRVSRLDSPDALPKLVHWRDTREFYPDEKRDKLPYCIGVTENRRFKWFDFASDPHVLVAGKSQSGKSNLVNGIIASSVGTHSPDELRLVLIDQKGGIEFTHWSEIPHLLWNVAKTLEDVKPILERVVIVMRKRMDLLEKSKTKDIAAYNARTDQRLPRIVVIIDEMNTFVGLGRMTDEIHNLIMLIVSQGRAVGIHMIAATQHPEVRVIPGRIKTNMSMRLSGAMPSITASQIVLDTADAARIPNIPGRFVAVVGMKTLVVQVPRIEDADIAHVVSKAKNDYPNTSDELEEMKSAPRLKVWDEDAVIEAALELNGGHLGGQKLHRLFGNESPGERHLNTMCKRVIDRSAAGGGMVEYRGEAYEVKKRNKGYYLIKSDESDGQAVAQESMSMSEVGLKTEGIEL